MLRYIYGSELGNFVQLRDSMFRDRAEQFKTRLGWEVDVDENGFEADQYDELNPLYVIWQRPNGQHGGSMRFLPTTGRTMVNEHFSHLTDGVEICSPLIWECTRFCLAPGSDARIAAALMLGGGELMRGFSLDHFVGVFDRPMTRIYRQIGSEPTVLGEKGEGRNKLSVGLWEFTDASRAKILERSGLSSALSEHWFDRAFGHTELLRESA